MEELKKDIGEEDIENGEVKDIQDIKNEIEQQRELGLGPCKDGFRCLNEDGEVITMERAKAHLPGTQYKFTLEETAQVESYMAEAQRRYPDVEAGVLKILVEDFVKHPDKVREAMYQDKKYCEDNNILIPSEI
jgi:hypothetical protein